MSLLVASGCGPSQQQPQSATFVTVEGPQENSSLLVANNAEPELPPVPKQDPDAVPGGDYLLELHPLVASAWRQFISDCKQRLPASHPLNQQGLSVQIGFEISHLGETGDQEVVSSSGNQAFDQAALDVVSELEPPKPPVGYVSDDGMVHILWTFDRSDPNTPIAKAKVERKRLPLTDAVARFLELGMWKGGASRLREDMLALETPTPEHIALTRLVLSELVRFGFTDQNPETVKASAQTAAVVPMPSAKQEMLAALASAGATSVKVDLVSALGRSRAKEAIGSVEILLRDDNLQLAREAAKALYSIGQAEKVQNLLGELMKAKPRHALLLLASAPVDGFDDAIIETLESRRNLRLAEVACEAAAARFSVGSKSVRRALVNALKKGKTRVRLACGTALQPAKDTSFGRTVFWTLSERLKKERSSDVRAAFVRALARLEPQKFADLLYLMRKERQESVLSAWASVLASLRPEGWTGFYRKLLRHRKSAVRLAAVRSLSGETGSFEADIAKLRTDSNQKVRQAAKSFVSPATAQTRVHKAEGLQAQISALEHLVRIVGHKQSTAITLELILNATSDVERVNFARVWLVSAYGR